MKLSEYLDRSDRVFFDVTKIDDQLAPTISYIADNIPLNDLANLCADLQSFANLLRLNTSDEIKSERLKRTVSMLAACLLVDYLQGHAELVGELMRAPTPVIPGQGEPPSTSEST